MDQMHDDMGWQMTGMGEMYKYMGILVPPHPPPRVYPDQCPFFTQQADPCHPLPSHPVYAYDPCYTQPNLSMPHFTQSC
ncbi:hypothetical protein Hanom_Chr05g00387821 [Helianthus anomalus]